MQRDRVSAGLYRRYTEQQSIMTEIIIDTYRCSSCGTCVEICPDVFYMDEITQKAALVAEPSEITDAIRQAAAFCPEKCIEIKG
ncbi:MAG: ferredoxin [Candidatus Electrothrix sp. YB6]